MVIYLTAFPMAPSKDVMGVALAEDGEVLASHISSNVDFSKYDMGLTSERKHARYEQHCPAGYTLEWADDPGTHDGWKAAMKLNQEKCSVKIPALKEQTPAE